MGGLLALEDLSGIDPRAPMRLREVSPIAHQSAREGKVAGLGNCGSAIFRGELGQLPAAECKIGIRGKDEPTTAFPGYGGENRLEFLFSACVQYLQLDSQ